MFYRNAILHGTWPFEGMTLADTGLFGDSWGAFTSIFSALGFCGVLWTIKLQQEATKKIEEDALKREQSERIRDFENSFFNILNILQTIISDIQVKDNKRELLSEGRGVFLFLFQGFQRRLKRDGFIRGNFDFDTNSYSKSFIAKEEMLKLYTSYYFSYTQKFSHYFRYLYNAYKFIDDAQMDDVIKRKYANILRAQLSNYELIMLFYNSLTPSGYKFQRYLMKYSVMDNLPIDKLLSKKQVVFLGKKCWGSNRQALDEYLN